MRCVLDALHKWRPPFVAAATQAPPAWTCVDAAHACSRGACDGSGGVCALSVPLLSDLFPDGGAARNPPRASLS